MSQEPPQEPVERDRGADWLGAAPLRPKPGWRLVRLASLFYGAMLLAAALWRVGWFGEPLFYASDVAATQGVDWLSDLAVGLLAAALVVFVSWHFTLRTRSGTALARALAEAIGPVSIPQGLLLAVISGICEEAFFRGALQPRAGLLLASILFGLAHFVPRRELVPWSAFSLASGLLLGGLFELTGNLLAPIAAHVGVNAVNLPLLARRYGGRSRS